MQSDAAVSVLSCSDQRRSLMLSLTHRDPTNPHTAPTAYRQNIKELVKALREAIDAEAAGAKEFEVGGGRQSEMHSVASHLYRHLGVVVSV
jgi:hypothetical protein